MLHSSKYTISNREPCEHLITRVTIYQLVNYQNLKIENVLAELPDELRK